jgi:hypothetical protein
MQAACECPSLHDFLFEQTNPEENTVYSLTAFPMVLDVGTTYLANNQAIGSYQQLN